MEPFYVADRCRIPRRLKPSVLGKVPASPRQYCDAVQRQGHTHYMRPCHNPRCSSSFLTCLRLERGVTYHSAIEHIGREEATRGCPGTRVGAVHLRQGPAPCRKRQPASLSAVRRVIKNRETSLECMCTTYETRKKKNASNFQASRPFW